MDTSTSHVIGTRAVHLALMEAGIRNRVEIWADGGYRHGWDIVKLHCLGANRVAFGTLAMVSIGCTICRGCQLDTCHVGIATQIDSMEEAEEKGLKKFTPQEFDRAVESCERFFHGMGEEVREVVASLGYERAQDLVGRSDLLVQARGKGTIDLGEMIRPLEEMLDLEPIDMPSGAEEEREEAGLIVARPIRMAEKDASHELASLITDVCGGPVSISGWGDDAVVALATGDDSGTVTARGPVLHEYSRPVDASDRVLGTELAGQISRARIFRPDSAPAPSMKPLADLHFNGGSIGGSGLGAFNVWGVDIRIEGGAQDGVGKTMFGGTIAVMKGTNRAGERVNGSVGKSFAYGAQRGRFFVQGSADSRFCIRLSGADVVIGGEPDGPIRDELGGLADRANIKGFAFEYMTSGRAVVLGDVGPWACAGQTGGRVYLRINEEWGLDRDALERRLGKGAKVKLLELDTEGVSNVQELLGHYVEELERSNQFEEARRVRDDRRRRRAQLPDVSAGAGADRPLRFDGVARRARRAGGPEDQGLAERPRPASRGVFSGNGHYDPLRSRPGSVAYGVARGDRRAARSRCRPGVARAGGSVAEPGSGDSERPNDPPPCGAPQGGSGGLKTGT